MSQDQDEGRSASLGRNPSGDYIKRRKSWQTYGRDGNPVQSTPDVRSFVGKQAFHRNSLRARAAAGCGSLPWQKFVHILLGTFAVLIAAGIVLTIIAVALHSSVVYTRWTEVRDGSLFYYESLDKTDAVILFATFVGAAAIVILVYGLFSIVLTKMEARQERKQTIVSLDDLAARDLEQGDAPLKTKQTIDKLMSDAEKQYVAEYMRKSATTPTIPARRPSGAAGTHGGQITVQKLDQGSPERTSRGAAPGVAPPRTWSLRRMLSAGRSEAERQKSSTPPSSKRRQESADWGIPSSEMAAQLSGPEAFNRASSSQAKMTDTPGWPEAMGQDSEPATPTTPKMGELVRQRLESNTDTDATPPPAGSTRIMVTKPIEIHGEGSAPSDSEEDDYDRERQHSILSHPAGASPFGSTILRRFPQQSIEEEAPSGSLGWQDVGLESDEEATSLAAAQQPGHIFAEAAGALDSQRSGESRPVERLELRPSDSTEAQDQQVQCHAEIELEEVLPRPAAGLLNRLLRLARVDRVSVSGQAAAFVIHPGKEYMVGIKLKHITGSEKNLSAKWIRIQPPDGQPVRFNIEGDASKPHEWSGSACWDTSLHSSEILGGESRTATPQAVPVQVTIALENDAALRTRIEAAGLLHVILYSTIHGRKSGDEASPTLTKLSPVATYCLL